VAGVETCWRCGADMRWVHGTWQCPRCRFKLGCCEGEPQSCTVAAPRGAPTRPAWPPSRVWTRSGATAPATRSGPERAASSSGRRLEACCPPPPILRPRIFRYRKS